MGCNACPGVSSQAGAFIVAILDIVGYAVSLIYALTNSSKLRQRLVSESDDDPEEINLIFNSAFGLIVGLNALSLLFSIILFVGIFKGSRKMLMAWMVMVGMHIIMMFLVALSPSNRSNNPPILQFFIRVYFLKVVYNHFDELKDLEVPGYIPTRVELGNPEGQGQGQGQGQRSGVDYDLESGFGVTPPVHQNQPMPMPMELPPTYESCVEKTPVPPPYDSCTRENPKT